MDERRELINTAIERLEKLCDYFAMIEEKDKRDTIEQMLSYLYDI